MRRNPSNGGWTGGRAAAGFLTLIVAAGLAAASHGQSILPDLSRRGGEPPAREADPPPLLPPPSGFQGLPDLRSIVPETEPDLEPETPPAEAVAPEPPPEPPEPPAAPPAIEPEVLFEPRPLTPPQPLSPPEAAEPPEPPEAAEPPEPPEALEPPEPPEPPEPAQPPEAVEPPQPAQEPEAAPLSQPAEPAGPQVEEQAPDAEEDNAGAPDTGVAEEAPDETAPSVAPEALSSPTPEEAERRIQPLRLGVLPAGDVARTIRLLEPLTRRLSDELGRPVEILSMSSYRAMIDAQILQRIDGGFYSASAYAAAEALCECLEPIVAPAADDDTVAYHAIIVAARDSGISSLADLEGKRVATAAPGSIGGYRMQLAGLMAEGYDLRRYFGGIRTTASAADAVRLLAAGEVDAAFAWSSLAGEAETGYTRGTLALLAESGEIDVSELAVVWRSEPIAHGPFAVAEALPDETKALLEEVLLDLDLDEPTAYDALAPLYGGGFAAVDPSDYAGVAMLLEHNVEQALPSQAVPEGTAENGIAGSGDAAVSAD